jgi:hypothetical protein
MREPRTRLLEVALRVVALAQARNVPMRIMGGVAFLFHEHEQRLSALRRQPGDVDVAIYGEDIVVIDGLLAQDGWRADREFNFLHGTQRLLYWKKSLRMDLFVDKVEMCHTIDLRGRLERSYPTLTLADLLLTKLQIVKLADKDVQDVVSLLAEHRLSALDTGADMISMDRVVSVCSEDWGFTHTAEINLKLVLAAVGATRLGNLKEPITKKIDMLLDAILSSPKSLKWRLRAKLGEAYPWYQVPEEDSNTRIGGPGPSGG